MKFNGKYLIRVKTIIPQNSATYTKKISYENYFLLTVIIMTTFGNSNCMTIPMPITAKEIKNDEKKKTNRSVFILFLGVLARSSGCQ